jgi:cell division topological specificity factor
MNVWSEIRTLLGGKKTSRDEAKGRLHLVLAHDRAGLDGAKLQELRNELAAVIRRYVPIDPNDVEVEVESVSRTDTQLVVSSPLRPR